MRGAIIYFSGTGNTEFVAKQFKREFEEKGVECSLVDVAKKKVFNDSYDFLAFGSPIHAEVFPELFMNWIISNIKRGRKREVIVFSTQAATKGSGADALSEILRKKGFIIKIQDFIAMPNNYYVVSFEKPTKGNIIIQKERAKVKVSVLVNKFLNGEESINSVSRARVTLGKALYRVFYRCTRKWAKNNLSVSMKRCVKCLKCVKNCPTKNIGMREEFEFRDKCISCQKCIHGCPVNAFLYKNREIEQYKL